MLNLVESHAKNSEKMNSNSGTTYTTMTSLGNDGGWSSIENSSTLNDECYGSISSRSSGNSTTENMQPITYLDTESSSDPNVGKAKIFDYCLNEFVEHRQSLKVPTTLTTTTCEDICIDFCRRLNILPTTRLLFGIRVYDSSNEWIPPGEQLKSNIRYCFRMRFKVPSLDTQLQILDPQSYEYLYRQMRHDMLRENIPEIRYPNKKDNVVGLGVVDMYIDELEGRDTPERIISNYKRYLPRSLIKAHKVFVKPKIWNSYRQFNRKNIDLAWLKWNYVHEVNDLAVSYLTEIYTAYVANIPDDDDDDDDNASNGTLVNGGGGGMRGVSDEMGVHVYVKIDLDETAEPSLKIARIAAEEKRKWMLIGTLNNIYALLVDSNNIAKLEVVGLPHAYRMKFEHECDLKSFITYLAGYIRLTCKWMSDICCQYKTPSLMFLNRYHIHGPIGGNFSYAKIREKRDECGRYLIRQCEKEYDTYYIDINTRIAIDNEDLNRKSCKTETFKISRDATKFVLHIDNNMVPFDDPMSLAKFIPADTEVRNRIRPSEYDQPPILLICLSKKLQSQKTDLELTEMQLQHKRVQIFDPKIDLQYYKNSTRSCDNGKMLKVRADWIQGQRLKDIMVTLKVLKDHKDFQDFMKLANCWSKIYSPHFLKLYGLTLSTPHTMVMEYAPYGPLNQFLLRLQDKASISMLLDIVYDLIRSIVYLRKINMVHGYIRCENLFVTKFNPQTHFLVAKLGDPGLSRSYTAQDLPWIPLEYYSNLDGVKKDHNAEAWAFATTVWEIFARGNAVPKRTQKQLNQEYIRTGAILSIPSPDCPDEVYDIIMDGWSRDQECRFNFHEFLSRINALKGRYSASIPEASSSTTIPASLLLEQSNEDQNGRIEEFEGFNDDSECVTSVGVSCLGKKHNYFSKINSVLEAPFGKLVWKKVIGEGHYGIVSMGEIQYNGPGHRVEKVAIKELKAETNKSISKDFEREIKIMQELNHPNIVKIKQWTAKPICIIMEYLEGGSFLIYLKTKAPDLSTEKLLRFSLDIAKGMEYLGSKSILHRDLAARNILVDHEHVKISDFGLAQIADANGYYVARSKRDIPYKWYSPDALSTEKYSFQTDVWSYGVTLYEMFSRGETPNLVPKEANEVDFLNRLEKGERLRKPAQCPDVVYTKLMQCCWNAVPKMRPTFRELAEEIQSILNAGVDQA